MKVFTSQLTSLKVLLTSFDVMDTRVHLEVGSVDYVQI